MHLPYEAVDIVATPVAFVGNASAVIAVVSLVVELFTTNRVGVEVVVNVQAVNIVAGDNIGYSFTYMVAIAL